jgi:hypothetical protein
MLGGVLLQPAVLARNELFDVTLPAAPDSPALSLMVSLPSDTLAPTPSIVAPRRVDARTRGAMEPLSIQGRAASPYSALLHFPAVPALPAVNTGGTPINRDGAGATGFAPAEATGAAGAAQYVQLVNAAIAIYRKDDGALLLGPVPTNLLWHGLTGSTGADACRTTNRGGAVIRYDHMDGRWIITQHAWTDPDRGPYFQCVAISTSDDATGSYHRYVFDVRTRDGAPVYNDYPQLSVWPDAYYFTFVLFDSLTGRYQGPRACALGRAAMVAGAPAAGRCADFGTAYGPVLAADLQGSTRAPQDSPTPLLALDFDASGRGERLYLWRMSYSSASISGAIALPVAPFTIACANGPCIVQPPPGELLGALSDRLQPPLGYRNFGDRVALVVTHAVQHPDSGASAAAVRWYEIRDPAGAVQVYQQGEVAPDADSRWAGSIAIDRIGNIAVGYSVSGPRTPPGLRYTGRLRTEPLGRMEVEDIIVHGTGAQVDTGSRWGYGSSMTIDPNDDCHFWYTNAYMARSGSFIWKTRLARMGFGNCR